MKHLIWKGDEVEKIHHFKACPCGGGTCPLDPDNDNGRYINPATRDMWVSDSKLFFMVLRYGMSHIHSSTSE